MPKNPNFFPYDGAQFCRPNWVPSNKVQAFAGELEAVQAKRRLDSQLKMDDLVYAANEADTSSELEARRAMLKREQDKCDCAPAEIQPRFVLQPTARSPLALTGDSIRPGGDENDPLAWLNDLGKDLKDKADQAGDHLAQASGQALCTALDAAGILQPAVDLAESAEEVLNLSDSNPNRAYAYGINYTVGAIPFFVHDLIQECDFGPAIKTFASAEARRMAIAHVVFKNMAYVSAAVGVAASVPTAGVSLIPAAEAAALASLAKALEVFWTTVSHGRWLSWEEIANIMDAFLRLDAAGSGEANAGFTSAVQDALEYSATVTEAQNAIQSALAQAAETTATLEAIERAFLQVDLDAPSGSLKPQPVAVQPSAVNPVSAVFPPPPNPLVVRPVLVHPNPGNVEPTYPEAGSEAPGPAGSGALPLLGLGLLLELF